MEILFLNQNALERKFTITVFKDKRIKVVVVLIFSHWKHKLVFYIKKVGVVDDFV